MKYTINLHAAPAPAHIHSEAGRVVFNGQSMMPFEAAMLGDALNECAESAENLAAHAAAINRPLVA